MRLWSNLSVCKPLKSECKTMKKTVFLFSILVFCLVQSVVAQINTASAVNNRGYLLGPGDQIVVKVLGEKDFDFESEVDENGNVVVPYSDTSISAMCKNDREIRAEVVKVFAKYLRNPQVSLRVSERKSRNPVTIGGEIKTPGNITLTRQTRLQELIAFSGGTTEDAGGLVQILRPQPPLCGSQEEVDQWKAESANVLGIPSRMYSLSGVALGSVESNPIVYAGDLIFIQKAKPVYFTGEVVSPRNLIIPEGGLSLQQAIGMLGGVTRTAKTKDIKIYRLKPDSKDRTIIPVNFDLIKSGKQQNVMLEPYDIVEVDKTKDSFLQILLKTVTGAGVSGVSAIATGGASRILY
jgi:polysaccharide biosynthesis/export protein